MNVIDYILTQIPILIIISGIIMARGSIVGMMIVFRRVSGLGLELGEWGCELTGLTAVFSIRTVTADLVM